MTTETHLPMTGSLNLIIAKMVEIGRCMRPERSENIAIQSILVGLERAKKVMVVQTPNDEPIWAPLPDLIDDFQSIVLALSGGPPKIEHQSKIKVDKTLGRIGRLYHGLTEAQFGAGVLDERGSLICTLLALEMDGKAIAYEDGDNIAWKASPTLLEDPGLRPQVR